MKKDVKFSLVIGITASIGGLVGGLGCNLPQTATKYCADVKVDKNTYMPSDTVYWQAHFNFGKSFFWPTTISIDCCNYQGHMLKPKQQTMLRTRTKGRIVLPGNLPTGYYFLQASVPIPDSTDNWSLMTLATFLVWNPKEIKYHHAVDIPPNFEPRTITKK
jgi:hypothetical protein